MSEQVLDYHTLVCLRAFFNACLILFLFYIPLSLPMKINFYAHIYTLIKPFFSVLKKVEENLKSWEVSQHRKLFSM